MKNRENISKLLSLFLFKQLNSKTMFTSLKFLTTLIAITLFSSLSIFAFPLVSQADDDDDGGSSSGGSTSVPTVPTNQVSMELMLSVDVSGSINSNEYALQKQGYIDAFNNPDVQNAIELLPYGLAVAIETWSGSVKDTSSWYKITTAAEAANFANVIASTLDQNSGSGSTDITEALESASSALINNDYYGDILVIDISGDGFDNTAKISSYDRSNFVNNYNQANGTNYSNYLNSSKCHYSTGIPVQDVVCPPLQEARDNAIANGIIINGLPIVSDNVQNDRQHELETYYRNNVIGGVHPVTGKETNSDGELVYFAEVAQDFDDFADAVAAKIQKEIEDAVDIVEEIELSNPDPNANRNPYVMNDTAATKEGESETIFVLYNDVDPDGDGIDDLSINRIINLEDGTSSSDTLNLQSGTVSIVNDTVVYQPVSGFSGTETFAYEAADGNGGTGQARITVTVGPEPPPTEETGDDVAPSFRAD